MTDAAPQILAKVTPSQPRRLFGVGALAVLGGLLLWVALSTPPSSILALGFLLGSAALSLVLMEAMRRATAVTLTLTTEALTDSRGQILARVADMERVDRGIFAFKPSNGFLLRVSTPAPAHWSPGLWWRLGRRIGVGGVVSAAQSRAMADIIGAMIAERKGI